jgi:predicted dithiol-disulfide oxidoreductase (DUF899 family)
LTAQPKFLKFYSHHSSIVGTTGFLKALPALAFREKELTRARDALAAERRRMPRMAVEKKYEFDGPKGKVSLLDLFEGRRRLIVYRAFFEPGVFGWPDHACRGCALGADLAKDEFHEPDRASAGRDPLHCRVLIPSRIEAKEFLRDHDRRRWCCLSQW